MAIWGGSLGTGEDWTVGGAYPSSDARGPTASSGVSRGALGER